jgi:hypothetical protein
MRTLFILLTIIGLLAYALLIFGIIKDYKEDLKYNPKNYLFSLMIRIWLGSILFIFTYGGATAFFFYQVVTVFKLT